MWNDYPPKPADYYIDLDSILRANEQNKNNFSE